MKIWYLRLYAHGRRPDNGGYDEWIMTAQELFQRIKHHIKIDVVDLQDGTVLRHDYKKPLPKWIDEPLVRLAAIATGKVP